MINNFIKEGKIVPVEVTIKLLLAAMSKSVCNKFLIDGFPRSIDNYEGWVRVVGDKANVAFCLFYECTEDQLQERLLKRGETSGRADDNCEKLSPLSRDMCALLPEIYTSC
jgi:adenylate kinase family enzyme